MKQNVKNGSDVLMLVKSNCGVSITGLFSETVNSRIHALVEDIENLDEYKRENDAYMRCLREIWKHLPEDKKMLTVMLDDYFSNILSVCEKYYYKNGFIDAVKLKDLITDRRGMEKL